MGIVDRVYFIGWSKFITHCYLKDTGVEIVSK